MANRELIVIRGNSGTGKSTVAKQLRSKALVPTALIEQDYLRRIILQEKESEGSNNIDLIEQTVSFALERGYNVILEGILRAERYKDMIGRMALLADSFRIYYLDASFQETLSRHATKPNAADFGETEMRRWYRPYDLLGLPAEHVIPETYTVDQTVQRIVEDGTL